MAKLTALLPHQQFAREERNAQLAWDAKHAPGPDDDPCDGCGTDLNYEFTHGYPDPAFGGEIKRYCRDCHESAEWLAGARAHQEHLGGAAHG